MGVLSQTILVTLITLLLSVHEVDAYTYYYSSWYIYVIIVFVIIAISSCVGACVRHRRHQMFLEQQRVLMTQGITVNTAGNANAGYNYGPYPQGQYPAPPPPGGLMQQPPAYNQDQHNPEKDPNMPPAYDEAVRGDQQTPYPPPQGAAPYPTQAPAPYPTQPAPYPTQAPAPYPTQAPAPYPTQAPAPYGAPPS